MWALKGDKGHSPYMKSRMWDHENYLILGYGKWEDMKLGTQDKVILTFELGNLQGPLVSPHSVATLVTEMLSRLDSSTTLYISAHFWNFQVIFGSFSHASSQNDSNPAQQHKLTPGLPAVTMVTVQVPDYENIHSQSPSVSAAASQSNTM